MYQQHSSIQRLAKSLPSLSTRSLIFYKRSELVTRQIITGLNRGEWYDDLKLVQK